MRLGSTSYTTDEGAFDAINAGTPQGVIYRLRDQLLALGAQVPPEARKMIINNGTRNTQRIKSSGIRR